MSIGACFLAEAVAVDFTWNPTGVNGNWNNPDNWQSPEWPLITNSRYTTLTFGASSHPDLNLDIAGTFLLNSLTFAGTAPDLALATNAGGGIQFRGREAGLRANLVMDANSDVVVSLPTTIASDLRISGSGTGTLTFTNGFTSLESYTLIKDSAGTLGFTGSSNTWKGYLQTNAGIISITNGSALLTNAADNITHQAYIGHVSGSNATVNVGGGTGSSLWNNYNASIVTGYSGTGTLNVSGGGRVAGGAGSIGEYQSGTGTVNVGGGTGASTWWNYLDLFVGNRGEGTLNVTGGGTVENRIGIVGQVAGSIGEVNVGGGTGASLWQNNAIMVVGQHGSGTLKITGGGTVTNTIGYIAYDADGTGTVEVGGGDGPSVWNSSHEVYVGSYGTGNLTITGGGTVTNTAGFVAEKLASTGTVKVGGGTGAATWTNSGNLYVGGLGKGSMAVTGGGTVASATGIIGDAGQGVGSVSVGGGTGEAKWTNTGLSFYVGNAGVGSLDITGGGTVTSVANNNASRVYVGNAQGSTGEIRIGGGTGNSQWTNYGNTYIGVGGTGSMEITGGGTVNTVGGFIGDSTGGTGTVTVDGSDGAARWSNTGQLTVGNSGSGSLSVTGGGSVGSGSAYIGRLIGGNGSVTVGGGSAGSSWNSGGIIYVGVAGTGSLSIIGGGSMSTAGGVLGDSYGSGTVNVGGGTGASSWSMTSAFQVGTIGRGTATITGGGTVASNGGIIGRDTRSIGTVNVGGGTGDAAWINNGALSVGGSGTGILNINSGGLVQAAALDGGNALSSVSFDGGTLRITASDAAGNRIVLNAGGGTIDSQVTPGGAFTLGGLIGGIGGLTKTGAGDLELSGSGNTYAGGTWIKQGVLRISAANAAGSGPIRVEAGAKLSITTQGSVAGPVYLGGGSIQHQFSAGASLADRYQVISDFAGVEATTAKILAGTSSAAQASELQHEFFAPSGDTGGLLSAVYSLTGTALSGTGTVPIALELSVGGENPAAFLGWLNPDTNTWENAFAGNAGNDAAFTAAGYFAGDFEDFQALHGEELADYIGAWGTYLENGSTHGWAVVNHGGSYALIPEPSSFMLLAGIGTFGIFLRRRGVD